MRKIINLLFLWVLLIIPLGNRLYAQEDFINIGAGLSVDNTFPFNNYFKNSYNQMVYSFNEVGTAGYIGAIIFQKDGNETRTFQELTIWLAHSSDSTMTKTSWVPEDSLRQVFHATNYEVQEREGDLMIPFDSSFYYDGVHHLAIVVSHKDNGVNKELKFRYTKKPSSCLYRRSSTNVAFGDYPGTSSGTIHGNRPNITLVKNVVNSFCLPVKSMVVTGITEKSIGISWNRDGNVNGFEVAIMDTATQGSDLSLVSASVVNDTFYSFTGLVSNTVYKIGIRQNCEANHYSRWETLIIRTTPTPNELPFVCDFENNGNWDLWEMECGEMVNRWVIGGGARLGDGSTYGMYVSKDTTKVYGYDVSESSVVYAKCLLAFNSVGEYNVKYDWYARGESDADYMRVFLVPAMLADEVVADSELPRGLSSTELPRDFLAADGGHKLNIASDWEVFNDVVVITRPGNYYMVVMWCNDDEEGVNPPAAIDNILVESAVCRGVDSVTVSNITAQGATIRGYSGGGTDFILYYKAYGDDGYDTVSMTSSYTLTDLLPGTYYYGELRSSCGINGDSYTTTPFSFGTLCLNPTLPWDFGAECNFVELGAVSGSYPYCWDMINGASEEGCWGYEDNRVNVYSGDKSITFVGSFSVSDIHDDWLMMPSFTFTGHEEISFWVKTTSSSESNNYHGRFALYASNELATGVADTAHYEQLAIAGENITNNIIDFVGNQWQKITIQLPSTLVGNRNLAFVVKDINSYTFCIDDIYLYTPNGCAMPDSVRITGLTSTSVDIEWTSLASSVEVFYNAVGASSTEVLSVFSTTDSVHISDLMPNTRYEFRVAAVCEGDVESITTYPIVLRTPCAAILSDELPFVEDFSDNDVGEDVGIDACWFKGTNNTKKYPYVDHAQSDRNPNSLYFYSNKDYYSYAVMPLFEESLDNLILSCSLHRHTNSSYNSNLTIGLMKNPYDISTFIAFDTLCPSTLGEWSDFQLQLADYDMAGGGFIAFLLPKGGIGYAHIDNIKVSLRGDCSIPYDLRANTVTAHSAIVSWKDSTASSWMVSYGPAGFSRDTVSNSITVSDTHAVEISGLLPHTDYEFIVEAVCDNNSYSTQSLEASFTTVCEPIASLPFVEDFESYDFGVSATIDDCWYKRVIGSTTQYPYPQTSAAINGSRGLYFRSNETATAAYSSYVVLPLFADPLPLLKISFNMMNNISTSTSTKYISKLVVGAMSNPRDLSTFDTISVIDMSDLPDETVIRHEILFGDYAGGGQYIALMAPEVDRTGFTTADNKVYVDDIEVSYAPRCTRPEQFTATTTATTAQLSWNGNAHVYEVKYSQHEDMRESVVLTVNADSVQLVGLASYTYYYVNVRGICGVGDTSEWMLAPERIRTAMDCGVGYENFVDTIGDAITNSNFYTINASSSYKNTCTWMIYTAEEIAELGLVSNHNIIKSISVSTKTAGTPLPLRIYMAETSLSQFNPDMSDTIPLSQMTLVVDDVIQFEENRWNEIMLETPFTYSDSLNLVIAVRRDSLISASTVFYYTADNEYRSAQYYHSKSSGDRTQYRRKYRANMIFNICGDIPSCVRPRHVVYSNVMPTSVDFAWEGSANSYQIVYALEEINPDTVPVSHMSIVNGTSTSLTNLQPHTEYYIYMRSVCGSEHSIWTNPIHVNTPCVPLDLPYSENFDSYPGGASSVDGQVMNSCWVKGTNGTTDYPYVSNSYAASGNNCLRFYGTSSAYNYAALPMFEDSIQHLVMTFKLLKTIAAQGIIRVGVMSNPYDVNTFQTVETVQPENIKVWENFEVSFSAYTGSGRYLAFLMPDSISSNAYLDNIDVFVNPTCPSPIDVVVATETITNTSASIQWTDRALQPTGGYELEYGPVGFELGTGTRIQSLTNPTVLSNLSIGTCYDVYVRAICSESDEGQWSFNTMFCTNCAPISLPVTYDFNTYSTDNKVIPHCFNRYNDATAESFQNQPYISAPQDDMNTQYLHFHAGTHPKYGNNIAMVFPEIDTLHYPMNEIQMSFMGKCDLDFNYIYVGVMENPNDYATYVVVDSVLLNGTPFEYTVSFANYTGHGSYPVILAKKGSTTIGYYVDNVVFTELPSCPCVYDLRAIGSTATTATLGWTDTIGTSHWILDYYEAGTNNVHSISVSTNPYTITGLSPLTQYYFNVRPICSSGDTTIPVRNDVQFWTSQVPITVPYFYDFEDVAEWNNWQTNSNRNTTWYRGDAVAGQGSHSMYVSIDEGTTRSTEWNHTVNTVVYRDIDFGTDTASYIMQFKVSVGGTVDHTYDGVSVLLVNPVDDVVASNSSITSPWGNVNDVAIRTIRGDTTWSTHAVNFDRVAGVHRIAFYWFNQMIENSSYVYIDAAAAIDSIVIKKLICNIPTDFSVVDTTQTTATLSWVGSANRYQLLYKADTSSVWSDTINLSTSTYVLDNLTPSTSYNVRLRALCGGNWGNSDWIELDFVTSEVEEVYICDIPLSLAVSNVTGNAATFTWNSGENYTNGELHVFNAILDTSIVVQGLTFTIVGLEPSTQYHVAVRAQCRETVYSDWGDTIEFTTLDCVPVSDVVVSNIAANSAKVSWTAGTDQTKWEVTYGVEDFDQGSGSTIVVTEPSYIISGLESETVYDVYVRVVCGDNFYSTWSAVNQFTTTAIPVCDPVTNVQATEITDVSTVITWTAGAGATSWEVSYGPQGTTAEAGTMVEVTEAMCHLTGLTAETAYDVYVRAVCGEDFYSEWSAVQQFTTLERLCAPVMGIAINNVTASSAAITWSDEEGQTAWELSYGPRGIAIDEGTKLRTTVAAYTLSGLQSDTEYDVYLRAQCDDKMSEWSSVQQFTTQPESQGIDGVEGNFHFAIYPNPTSGVTTISLNGVEGKVMISIVDMNGRTVANETIECGVDCEKHVDVTNLAQGTYFVRVLGDNLNSVRKLIVR